jgi:hypothetical protein
MAEPPHISQTIDLINPSADDYFKIGVAHGQLGVAKKVEYLEFPSYHEGHAQGSAQRPYLYPLAE